MRARVPSICARGKVGYDMLVGEKMGEEILREGESRGSTSVCVCVRSCRDVSRSEGVTRPCDFDFCLNYFDQVSKQGTAY